MTSAPCWPATSWARSARSSATRSSRRRSARASGWRRARPTGSRSSPSRRAAAAPTSTTSSPRRCSAVSEPATRRRGLPTQVKMRHSHHFVDELTARSETPVGRFVPLAEIEPDPAQPRSAMGSLDDLVASIRDKGVLEPLLVRRHPEGGREKTHLIISGERRFHAALAAGLFEVPVIELEVSDQEALEIALI